MSDTKAQQFKNVTCPFCGLLCDDLNLKVKQQHVLTSAQLPDFCKNHYRQASLDTLPSCVVEGEETSLESALHYTCEALQKSQNPLFYGMGVDVQGARRALQLAEYCGGSIDHINSACGMKNARVMQDEGWILGTFSELINHADTIVVLGADALHHFPRLLERLTDKQGLYHSKETEFVLIGPWQTEAVPELLKQHPHRIIIVEPEQLHETIQNLSLAIQYASRNPDQEDTSNSSGAILRLAKSLLACRYSAFVWAASEFDTTAAHVALETLSKMIKCINIKTRCVAFPLGGSLGDTSFYQVATWQSGFPNRISFAQKFPEYHPERFDGKRLLAQKETDLLLWISTLTTQPPPLEFDPCIVIGHPAISCQSWMRAYIPVGIPGVDHAGHLFRTDAVVTLPLKKLRDCKLPSASQVLETLYTRLRQNSDQDKNERMPL